MSTALTLQIHSTSSDATVEIGRKIGRNLKGGEIIELVSDLGGGKTTLVRGIAEGMGSTDKVASPTFTVSKEYRSQRLRLVHYDFYRLHDAGILEFELAEALSDPQTITVVEWADIVQDVLPANRVTIRITSTSDETRELHISATDTAAYMFEGIQT